jgi:hypothetical protein
MPKLNYFLRQKANADETPLFFYTLASTTIHTKQSTSVLVKITGHEKQRMTVILSVLDDVRSLTPFVIMKRKSILGDLGGGGGVNSYWN